MIRRPPRSTQSRSSAASDVYKRQADARSWKCGVLEHEYEGPDGVIKYLTSLFAMTDGTFKSESEALFAADDRVVSLDHVTGTRMGNVLDTHVVHAVSYTHLTLPTSTLCR